MIVRVRVVAERTVGNISKSEMGLSDTKADVIDETLNVVVVWGREWWRRSLSAL